MSWLHFNQGDIVYALGNLHKLGQLYKITWYWEEDSELSYHEYLEKVRDFCPDIDPFMYMDDPKNWTA